MIGWRDRSTSCFSIRLFHQPTVKAKSGDFCITKGKCLNFCKRTHFYYLSMFTPIEVKKLLPTHLIELKIKKVSSLAAFVVVSKISKAMKK